jgi:hypothetical protein
MIRSLLGLAYEGVKLYMVLSFLAWAMAIPHTVAHWLFAVLVSIVGVSGLITGDSRSPKTNQPS